MDNGFIVVAVLKEKIQNQYWYFRKVTCGEFLYSRYNRYKYFILVS